MNDIDSAKALLARATGVHHRAKDERDRAANVVADLEMELKSARRMLMLLDEDLRWAEQRRNYAANELRLSGGDVEEGQ